MMVEAFVRQRLFCKGSWLTARWLSYEESRQRS